MSETLFIDLLAQLNAEVESLNELLRHHVEGIDRFYDQWTGLGVLVDSLTDLLQKNVSVAQSNEQEVKVKMVSPLSPSVSTKHNLLVPVATRDTRTSPVAHTEGKSSQFKYFYKI